MKRFRTHSSRINIGCLKNEKQLFSAPQIHQIMNLKEVIELDFTYIINKIALGYGTPSALRGCMFFN